MEKKEEIGKRREEMRLIDADALMKEFTEFVKDSNNSDFADVPTWNDAVSLVGSMPSAQRWIPCNDRLPEGDTRVLCCTLNKKGVPNIVLGYYIPESGCWACGMNSNVVAWMPLPEPYEEEKHD